ncbi:uncharacterized protein LOC132954468 [Labrus mixtus]|uniref:uncharacterized protein LOC132954468 n=1 Tax=Labrus mixtus TaxID=508554 RepID=UPI0029C0206F|nr:uncharacterized protein LOC132954468 [Labrus mixtus]
MAWAENDFFLPPGVVRLGLSAPVNGRKYVMYHGTTSQAAQSIQANGFQQSTDGMLGPGVYLSRDLEKARRYPINHPEDDKVVIKVEVNVGKVTTINKQGHPRQKTWHDSRYGEVYDTAWVPTNCGMVPSGLEEDCVWDPSRIKIINKLPPGLARLFGLGLSKAHNGRKYVMYHGTTSKAARSIQANGFQRSSGGMLGPGVYLSRDLDKASRYPIGHPESDKVVIKVVVDVGKVIAINRQGHPRQKTWHDSSYGKVFDTAWVPPNCGMVKSGLEEDCVWDPDRIEIIKIIQPRQSEDVVSDRGPQFISKFWKAFCSLLSATVSLSSGYHPESNGQTERMNQELETCLRCLVSHNPSSWSKHMIWADPFQCAYGYQPPLFPELESEVSVPSAQALIRCCRRIWRQARLVLLRTSPSDTDTSMPYQWAEDDGGLPYGVIKLGHSQPVSGRRYVMYHGTTRQAARSIKNRGFCRSKDGMLGPGVYLSRDLDKASRYPIGHPESDKVVIKVVVDVGRVIAINRQGHPRQKTWHDSSYGKVFDTAWVPPNCGMVPSGLEEDCVWDPSRIEIIKIIQPRQSEGAGLAAVATAVFGVAAILLFAALGRN